MSNFWGAVHSSCLFLYAKKRGKYFLEVAEITLAMMADVIGKIRDQGSNFRHETVRSAADLATSLILIFIKYT